MFELPVLPLEDMSIYPRLVMPLMINHGRGLKAVRAAQEAGTTVIVAEIVTENVQDASGEDLFSFGTEIAVGSLIPSPDEMYAVLVEGRRRVQIVEYVQTNPYIIARVRVLEEEIAENDELEVLEQTVNNLFQQVADLNESIPENVIGYLSNVTHPGWLADFVGSMLTLSRDDRQFLLKTTDVLERLRFVVNMLGRELSILELKDEINGQIQQEISRSQRENYLREQMRVIQGELGEEDFFQQELRDVHEQIVRAKLPDEIHEKAMKELERLQIIPPIAPEVGMIRTYIDWLIALPWEKTSEDNLDVKRAQTILDAEHHGLPKVKDRVLEHIAVRKLAADKMKTPILCFAGPPGVGKTSLGKSIATALGREFVRVSLGGVRDEAEIRGHRRTYIGSMPGRIIQTMRRAGTTNPVFMLDEIDKLGVDFRGDPAAALLEALDPEQNREYSDHYMDVDYDLSKVLFITTANDLYPLPDALLDRLEVIEFPGYTEEDKLEIARLFLIPKQLESHGLLEQGIQFEQAALQTIIREYTYEAGVRNLNREIGTILRKIARLVAEERRFPKRITAKKVTEYLGPPQFIAMRANDEDAVGIVTGLSWTAGGGDILTIEAALLPGKGSLTLTGQLGDVMQESAQAALSYVRGRARDLEIPTDDFDNYDIHIHLPEGAIPKEGPSAGITLATAMLSIFLECKIRSDHAMTGEITLRGRVLPVGGIKEKVLAAHRAQIKNVILPEQNRKDLVDVPAKALRDMNIIFVENMQQVVDIMLLDPPAEGRSRDLEKEQDDADQQNDGDDQSS